MAAPVHPKLQSFDIIPATFKQVGNHGIRADILVPQTPYNGKRPTIVRFHGGGLMIGDSLYTDFWPHWLSDLALQHGAVIVSPNYRLMPQATGLDIYDDVEDFWAWLRSPAVAELLAAHTTPTELDLTRILLAGESAGGLLSVNSALAHAPEIRAATALYPALNPCSPDFATPRDASLLPFGQHTPKSLLEDYLASIAPDVPLSSTVSPSYLPLMLAAVEYGRLGAWYERGAEGSPRRSLLFPIEQLEKPDVQVPRGGITIIQGRQDSVVPPHHSESFVARAREVARGKAGGDKIALIFQDGEHGFDGGLRYEEEWLREALKTAVEAWLE
ncbi:Alpha/Beta hydrolase protein [Aspergillus aurantiobrunneus]